MPSWPQFDKLVSGVTAAWRRLGHLWITLAVPPAVSSFGPPLPTGLLHVLSMVFAVAAVLLEFLLTDKRHLVWLGRASGVAFSVFVVPLFSCLYLASLFLIRTPSEGPDEVRVVGFVYKDEANERLARELGHLELLRNSNYGPSNIRTAESIAQMRLLLRPLWPGMFASAYTANAFFAHSLGTPPGGPEAALTPAQKQ